jgi:integrase
MHINIARHVSVKIKYVYCSPSGALYWQRRPPVDLVHRYDGQGTLKERIGRDGDDPRVIAEKVARMNGKYEAIWEAMRKDETLSPMQLKSAAERLLREHGIYPADPLGCPGALAQWSGKLDSKREAYAASQHAPEEAYRNTFLSDFLSPVEAAAVALVKGERFRVADGSRLFLLSDALAVYLGEHPRGNDPKWVAKLREKWALFIKFAGDRVFAEFTRDDAKAYRDHMLTVGNKGKPNKTDTVRRRINDLQAIFAKAIAEALPRHDQRDNVWEKLTIRGLRKDASKRESLAGDAQALLRAKCRAVDDPLRWMLALQLDLGTRIAEPAGFLLSDFVLSSPTPHVIIQAHPWRSLKTGDSNRKVPLVGDALWAAQRVCATAVPGQAHAFPRYCTTEGVRADSAGAAANKWMKENGIPHTTHELRHTLRTRMDRASAPAAIQAAIGGWSGGRAIMEEYGEGQGLKVLAWWLRRTLPGAVDEAPIAPLVVPLSESE